MLSFSVSVLLRPSADGSLVGSSTNVHTLDLKRRLQEMEDSLLCAVCMERKKDTVFMCGHAVCSKCSDALQMCPMCRKAITRRIPLYTWGRRRRTCSCGHDWRFRRENLTDGVRPCPGLRSQGQVTHRVILQRLEAPQFTTRCKSWLPIALHLIWRGGGCKSDLRCLCVVLTLEAWLRPNSLRQRIGCIGAYMYVHGQLITVISMLDVLVFTDLDPSTREWNLQEGDKLYYWVTRMFCPCFYWMV